MSKKNAPELLEAILKKSLILREYQAITFRSTYNGIGQPLLLATSSFVYLLIILGRVYTKTGA